MVDDIKRGWLSNASNELSSLMGCTKEQLLEMKKMATDSELSYEQHLVLFERYHEATDRIIK